jgi:DNA-binding transcriptional LysR family regulator
MRALDLNAVEAFVLVADLRSFTRAAEAAGTTQSAVSLKLKRLERRLGRRLLERTPRLVRLSAEGSAFLDSARSLLAAHERALGRDGIDQRLKLGISDHAAGPELAPLLAQVNAHDPSLVLDVRVAASHDLVELFDRGGLDAVIVRSQENRRDGELLLRDQLRWFAAPIYRHRAGQPIRIATLSSACGVRAYAVKALEAAKIPWIESFVGGGIIAVAAAVTSGLAVAPLASRIAPAGAIDVGPRLGLPKLPRSDVVLHSRTADPRLASALRVLAATFRASAG